MIFGTELPPVESLFIDQLVGMDWKLATSNLEEPSGTEREMFREALINSGLRKAIEQAYCRDGNPWLDEVPISQVASALKRIAAPSPARLTRLDTALRMKGVAVEGFLARPQGRSRTALDVDWERAVNTTFTVVEGAA